MLRLDHMSLPITLRTWRAFSRAEAMQLRMESALLTSNVTSSVNV